MAGTRSAACVLPALDRGHRRFLLVSGDFWLLWSSEWTQPEVVSLTRTAENNPLLARCFCVLSVIKRCCPAARLNYAEWVVAFSWQRYQTLQSLNWTRGNRIIESFSSCPILTFKTELNMHKKLSNVHFRESVSHKKMKVSTFEVLGNIVPPGLTWFDNPTEELQRLFSDSFTKILTRCGSCWDGLDGLDCFVQIIKHRRVSVFKSLLVEGEHSKLLGYLAFLVQLTSHDWRVIRFALQN